MKKLKDNKTYAAKPSDRDVQKMRQIKRMAKANAILLVRSPALGAMCGKG